jgi:hypothetical protein
VSEGGAERGGQGASERDFDQDRSDHYCDDTGTLANSIFRRVDSDEASDDGDGALGDMDMVLAESMSELSVMKTSKKAAVTAPAVSAASTGPSPPRRSSLFRWASMSSVPT